MAAVFDNAKAVPLRYFQERVKLCRYAKSVLNDDYTGPRRNSRFQRTRVKGIGTTINVGVNGSSLRDYDREGYRKTRIRLQDYLVTFPQIESSQYCVQRRTTPIKVEAFC